MWPINCIQSSHPQCSLLGVAHHAGDWVHYDRWREARRFLGNTRTTSIAVKINDAAIAICYKGTADTTYSYFGNLPFSVLVALTRDYLQLPVWCRNPSGQAMINEAVAGQRDIQPGTPMRQLLRSRTSSTMRNPYV
ncbi:hypothetical protein QQ045_017046 [Rhodiola kirilowii]